MVTGSRSVAAKATGVSPSQPQQISHMTTAFIASIFPQIGLSQGVTASQQLTAIVKIITLAINRRSGVPIPRFTEFASPENSQRCRLTDQAWVGMVW